MFLPVGKGNIQNKLPRTLFNNIFVVFGDEVLELQ
jgi:hypothetical protein